MYLPRIPGMSCMYMFFKPMNSRCFGLCLDSSLFGAAIVTYIRSGTGSVEASLHTLVLCK